MTYYRGTEEQFNAWEKECCIAEEIPVDGSGKIGLVRGKESPDNQRTVRYASCIHNLDDQIPEVIWNCGKYPVEGMLELSHQDAIDQGFIQDRKYSRYQPK